MNERMTKWSRKVKKWISNCRKVASHGPYSYTHTVGPSAPRLIKILLDPSETQIHPQIREWQCGLADLVWNHPYWPTLVIPDRFRHPLTRAWHRQVFRFRRTSLSSPGRFWSGCSECTPISTISTSTRWSPWEKRPTSTRALNTSSSLFRWGAVLPGWGLFLYWCGGGGLGVVRTGSVFFFIEEWNIWRWHDIMVCSIVGRDETFCWVRV